MQAVEECVRTIQARGLTIQQIADECGCHPETLRGIRKGEVSNPGFSIIANLHRLAGRSLDLLAGIQLPAPPQTGTAPVVDPAELARELLRELGRLGADRSDSYPEDVDDLEPDLRARHSATRARRDLGDAGRTAIEEITASEEEKRASRRRRA